MIARHDWQHSLVGAVKVFLHPEVRAFTRATRARRSGGSRVEGQPVIGSPRKGRPLGCAILPEIDRRQGA